MPRPLFLFTTIATLLVFGSVADAQTVRNMQVLAHFDQYGVPGGAGYSACWSYVHSDGREYAVLGTVGGTAIYNVTNPASSYFVGFIPGRTSSWREMKQYRSWIYVVTESGPGATGPVAGVQIIRMTNPELPVLAATYATNFQTSHTVSVDTSRAILICNGTRAFSGGNSTPAGMRFLSLASPEAPVEIGWWPGGGLPVSSSNYVHDSVPIGNRLYASSINAGIQRVLNFTTPASTTQISSWTYPGAFTHNAWPDATGNYLYVTDEVNGEPLKVFNITNPAAPVLVNTLTSNPQAIVHNAHVRGSELYLSNYTEGIRVLDLSDPAHPAEFAWADSYAGPSGGFNGVWEVCPYFPSGTVIASDMNTGLYVYRPVRNYGLVRVSVIDEESGDPVAGATVYLNTGDSLTTYADGVAQFAPNLGSIDVWARKYGHVSAQQNTDSELGDIAYVEIVMPTVPVTGVVSDSTTLAPLREAEVHLSAWATQMTETGGDFFFPQVPPGPYSLEVRAPGHVHRSLPMTIASDPMAEIRLVPTPFWDAIEAPSGWTVGAVGDNATTGIWTRVDPLGTGFLRTLPRDVADARRGSVPDAAEPVSSTGVEGTHPPLEIDHEDHEPKMYAARVQPENDRTPSPGSMCFVTGQGTDPASTGEADVDNGYTTLTSPLLDLSGMAEPTIAYWYWFYGNTPPDDALTVAISNDDGFEWYVVKTITGIHNTWTEDVIRVADYVAPSAQMRLRFIAVDNGTPSLVEAAIDDLAVYDAAVPSVQVPPPATPARLEWRAPSPNPSRETVTLALEMPQTGPVEVDVLDVTGRLVRSLHRGPAHAGVLTLAWSGADDSDRLTAAGLYFVRARAGGQTAHARVARVW